ncbi:hypothetical protein Tco_1074505, partial [Tanacetum coccineum]
FLARLSTGIGICFASGDMNCGKACVSKLCEDLGRVQSRLVSDSTTRDVEWEPIEEERLEEPKEGWMLGESKKRCLLRRCWFDIRALPYSIYRGPLNSFDVRVMYKAEKVCHEEMVKMPLVDLKVLEVYMKSKKEHESHLKMNLKLLKKEKCHVKPNKDIRIGGPSRRKDIAWWVVVIKREWSRSMSIKGLSDETARHGVHMSSIPDKDGMHIETDGQSERTFRTLENMFRACVRNLVVVGIRTFREAEIGESKMIGLELEQETTKVVVIKERPKEVSLWKGVVRFDKKGELAPRYIGTFEILERIGPVAYRLRLPDELSIGSYLSGVKITSKPEIALNFFRTLSLYKLIS